MQKKGNGYIRKVVIHEWPFAKLVIVCEREEGIKVWGQTLRAALLKFVKAIAEKEAT